MESETKGESAVMMGVPSPRAQSWGTLVSIVVIVIMVIVGAFYAWEKRVSENGGVPDTSTTTTEMP